MALIHTITKKYMMFRLVGCLTVCNTYSPAEAMELVNDMTRVVNQTTEVNWWRKSLWTTGDERSAKKCSIPNRTAFHRKLVTEKSLGWLVTRHIHYHAGCSESCNICMMNSQESTGWAGGIWSKYASPMWDWGSASCMGCLNNHHKLHIYTYLCEPSE